MAFDFPASPSEGATYTPAGGPTYVFQAGVWRVLPPSSGVPATATVSDTAPLNPVPGQIWWKSDSGETFIWFVDANSSQWVQQSDTSLPDAPSDGGFYARQNGGWVPVPKYQRFGVAGVRLYDVQVPTGATHARITGQLMMSTLTASYPILQLSVAAGVFLGTAGQYTLNGFQHSTVTTPTAVGALAANSTIGGMMLTTTTEHRTIPVQFEGQVMLKRSRTDIVLTGDFRGSTFNNTLGCAHTFYHNYCSAAALGSALQVLALRFAGSDVSNVWDTDSFINVEWL